VPVVPRKETIPTAPYLYMQEVDKTKKGADKNAKEGIRPISTGRGLKNSVFRHPYPRIPPIP